MKPPRVFSSPAASVRLAEARLLRLAGDPLRLLPRAPLLLLALQAAPLLLEPLLLLLAPVLLLAARLELLLQERRGRRRRGQRHGPGGRWCGAAGTAGPRLGRRQLGRRRQLSAGLLRELPLDLLLRERRLRDGELGALAAHERDRGEDDEEEQRGDDRDRDRVVGGEREGEHHGRWRSHGGSEREGSTI
jgi:hypothetical protein